MDELNEDDAIEVKQTDWNEIFKQNCKEEVWEICVLLITAGSFFWDILRKGMIINNFYWQIF